MHIESPEESRQKLLEIISEFKKVVGNKDNTQKSIYFYILEISNSYLK